MSNIADGKTGLSVLEPQSSLIDYGAAAVSGAVSATGIPTGGSVLANAGIGFVKKQTGSLYVDHLVKPIIKAGIASCIGGRIGKAIWKD